ncbi:MAG TPA: WG repeat-containing protein [Parapedobacter sp.]|nr:WG repeat-containing protein [Parapedobacter sp.]
MHFTYKRLGVFLLLFLCALVGRAQGIVEVASPQAPATVGLGIFKNGWAKVTEGESNLHYIDTAGTQFRFYDPNNILYGTPEVIDAYQKELVDNPQLLPQGVVVFEKGGAKGVVDATGKVLIPAEYDQIDMEYRQFWKLYKDGKLSYYLPGGEMLPFFEDIGYLDGEYFDVQQAGSWHIYQRSTGKIISKSAYEAFDYCGGCGSASPYVYAKKGGKWGIIDWEENILLPFVYDHEHRGMRSDNWVASFSKNGNPVIVHLLTQQEFDASGPDTELQSGMLITKQDGKCGAYNRDGLLRVPFVYDNVEVPNPNSYLGYYGDYLIVEQGQQKGIVRSDGVVVVPVEYEKVMVYDDYFVVTKNGTTSLLAIGQTEPLIQVNHGEITHINDYFYSSGNDGLAIFRVKQQAYYGLYFADSDVYHAPEFYDISVSALADFDAGRVIVADNQGQKKLFSLSGELLLPFEVEDFEVFDALEEPLLAVNVGGKWGLYDLRQKKEVIPPRYDRFFKVLGDPTARFIRGTMAVAGELDRYALYHTDGRKAIDQDVSSIEPIDSRYYLIGLGEEKISGYAVYDGEMDKLEPLDYLYASLSDSPSLLVVSNDRISGKLYDVAAKKELGRDYWIFMFSGESPTEDALKAAPGRWGLSYFSKGLAQVFADSGKGYIDEHGKVVIEPRFERVELVGEKYAVVNEAGSNGVPEPSYYINRTNGKRVFPKAYFVDDMLLYNLNDYELDDVAILVKDEEDPTRFYGYRQYSGLGNLETGNILAEAVFDEIRPLYNFPYLILVQTVGDGDGGRGTTKYGLATKAGEILFEPRFDDIYYDDRNSYAAWQEPDQEHVGGNIFPLLVREGDMCKYINADGTYLPIAGDYALRY